ncbi:MAG: 4Fe-4S binding protein, partial [Eggerthellaceae bacterium]|nr:4Fe-4S binding protein [Eggerthellaceae bacterium]
TRVCPTGAMNKDAETGLVSVDETKCIGCGYCHMSCPYNAPKVDREKGHSVKCNGCLERVREGEQPICVRACPARALEFGPVDEIAKLDGELARVYPLPEPAYTNPNFYIKPCDDARYAGDTETHVANPNEVK